MRVSCLRCIPAATNHATQASTALHRPPLGVHCGMQVVANDDTTLYAGWYTGGCCGTLAPDRCLSLSFSHLYDPCTCSSIEASTSSSTRILPEENAQH